jgi:TonB family protein
MSAIRVTVRASRSALGHWITMGGFSVVLHAATFAVILFAPQFFQPKVKFPEVYTVDLVSLPAGDPGPPAEGPRASAPAAAAAPAPAPPEPAVKIPEKPQAALPKPKPVPKKEPPKPKVEKVEKKEKPVPKARPAAAESSRPVESGDSSREGTGNEKSAGTAPTGGSSASTGGGPGIPGATGPGGAGGSGFLDDPTFEYGWYLTNMSSILSRNWSRPIRNDLTQTLRAKIHFRVLKDGTLADIVLEQPSGDAALDRSALRAVQDSNPLPPLPFQYGKDSLGVHFFFDLKAD